MELTTNQKRAATLRNRNLLVSAGAGSGKTSVLIERILKMITDPSEPLDVDRLLVVTFTEAAAEEMKNRLYKGIMEKMGGPSPEENRALRKQLQLLPNAQISTIHSFCSRILQDYFYTIDLDPGFRIGDTAELQLLEEDALQELFESEFQKADPSFINLSDIFGVEDYRNSQKITLPKIVKNIYHFSRNFKDPEAWILKASQNYPSLKGSETEETALLVSKLSELTIAFSEKFRQEKMKRRIIDFSDLERYALQILSDNGKRTEIAAALSERFTEVLIDEYQDINEVQEAILQSVSGEDAGKPNRFMVGDMKQSIYGFRGARPDLFIVKYDRYSSENSAYQRIELAENFRSRSEVGDSVNYVFDKCFLKEHGGIAYTEDQKMLCHADYPESELPLLGSSELICIENGKPSDFGQDRTKEEAEAAYVASEIQKIVGKKYVCDKGTYRKAAYRDIVILLRSAKGTANIYSSVLEQFHIPVYCDAGSVFYEAAEINFMINLLSVIHNPLQDIPLLSVLLSPYFAFTAEELAEIKNACEPRTEFYGILKSYEGPLREKIRETVFRLERYRKKAEEMKLSLLLRYLYQDLHILSYASAKPNGKVRHANLMLLLEKAEDYETTSYAGIYHFLRYVEKKIEVAEDGEASVIGENDDVVRIMTIHKSKGLEFPVVFLCNLGKKFNIRSLSEPVLLDAEKGIALKEYHFSERYYYSGTYYRETAEKMKKDFMAEELRMLYVAMTRAKEKLYLVGQVPGKTLFSEMAEYFDAEEPKITPETLNENNSFMKLLLLIYRNTAPLELKYLTYPDIPVPEAFSDIDETSGRKLSGKAKDDDLRKVTEKLDRSYRESELSRLPMTVSVSFLKHEAMEETEGNVSEKRTYHIIRETEEESENGISDGSEVSPARLGTLYHLLFEKLNDGDGVGVMLDRLLSEGLISDLEKGKINQDLVGAFYQTDLGIRLTAAHGKGKLFREQPFVMGLRADEVFPEKTLSPETSGELVMVQGVIDAYFIEDDGIVLLDYKTDRTDNEKVLIERYRKQLWFYRDALQKATGKKVKEAWIYGVRMKKAIEVPLS